MEDKLISVPSSTDFFQGCSASALPNIKKGMQKPMLCTEKYFRVVLLSCPLTNNPLRIGLDGDFQQKNVVSMHFQLRVL